MTTQPSNQPTGGFRLSGLALTGIIVLALLLGLMLGAIVGGAGGFLAGRNNARTAAAVLPNAQSQSSSPSALAGGTSGQTQPNSSNPQAQPNGANPQTPFGGRGNRQTQPGGTTPQTQPGGSNPQVQPNGSNPQTPFGGRGNRQTPSGGTVPQTQPNGSNPQVQPDGANPQTPFGGRGNRQTQPGQGSNGETPDENTPAQPSLGVYLGIRYTALTSDMADQFGITDLQGAAVGEVVSGSPAEKAGLQPMDVITAVDGKQLSDTYTLIDALSGHKPGDTIKLTVWRMGQSETIEVTLGSPAGQG
ncbi:MAG: PDZ domain-containing protein [Anaerolineae bacterium]